MGELDIIFLIVTGRPAESDKTTPSTTKLFMLKGKENRTIEGDLSLIEIIEILNYTKPESPVNPQLIKWSVLSDTTVMIVGIKVTESLLLVIVDQVSLWHKFVERGTFTWVDLSNLNLFTDLGKGRTIARLRKPQVNYLQLVMQEIFCFDVKIDPGYTNAPEPEFGGIVTILSKSQDFVEMKVRFVLSHISRGSNFEHRPPIRIDNLSSKYLKDELENGRFFYDQSSDKAPKIIRRNPSGQIILWSYSIFGLSNHKGIGSIFEIVRFKGDSGKGSQTKGKQAGGGGLELLFYKGEVIFRNSIENIRKIQELEDDDQKSQEALQATFNKIAQLKPSKNITISNNTISIADATEKSVTNLTTPVHRDKNMF